MASRLDIPWPCPMCHKDMKGKFPLDRTSSLRVLAYCPSCEELYLSEEVSSRLLRMCGITKKTYYTGFTKSQIETLQDICVFYPYLEQWI